MRQKALCVISAVVLSLPAANARSEVLRRICGSTQYDLIYDTRLKTAVIVTVDHVDIISAEKVEKRDGNDVIAGTTKKGVHIMAIFAPDGTGTVGIFDAKGDYIGKDICKRELAE